MKKALNEAEKAYEQEEVPVGAVIVRDDQIIAKAHNMNETLEDPTAHAEILAITQATDQIKTWRLENCDMYVTLEPCAMCAGALVQARIDSLWYGASDSEAGACGSLYNIVQDHRLNHFVDLEQGLLENECGKLLKQFFQERRNT